MAGDRVRFGVGIKQRAGHLDAVLRGRTLERIKGLVAASFAVAPVTGPLCDRATTLIERSLLPLRGGDALHLAIAADAGAVVWTLDRRMAEAGQALGLGTRLLA